MHNRRVKINGCPSRRRAGRHHGPWKAESLESRYQRIATFQRQGAKTEALSTAESPSNPGSPTPKIDGMREVAERSATPKAMKCSATAWVHCRVDRSPEAFGRSDVVGDRTLREYAKDGCQSTRAAGSIVAAV
jgi:hypothetical protein